MFEAESSSWATPVSTAITVVGGILAAFAAYLIDKWKTKRNVLSVTEAPGRHIDNITDAPTREALLAIHDEIYLRQQVVNGFLNAQGLACWESDKNGAWIFVSDRLAEIIGCDKSDIYGDGWSQAIAPDHKKKVEEGMAWAVLKRVKFRMRFPFRHIDGKYVWVCATAQPILRETREHDGTLSRTLRGMVGVLTVIQEGTDDCC